MAVVLPPSTSQLSNRDLPAKAGHHCHHPYPVRFIACFGDAVWYRERLQQVELAGRNPCTYPFPAHNGYDPSIVGSSIGLAVSMVCKFLDSAGDRYSRCSSRLRVRMLFSPAAPFVFLKSPALFIHPASYSLTILFRQGWDDKLFLASSAGQLSHPPLSRGYQYPPSAVRKVARFGADLQWDR